MSVHAIDACDLVKRYKGRERPALDGLSLEVGYREIIGLLGPNGAGKTTFIKILSGVIPATSGCLRVLGLEPSANPAHLKRRLAVVHQRSTFDLFLTARDNLKIATAFRGLKWGAVSAHVEALIAEFQLEGKCDQPVFTLSGGEQRRVQVIRALLTTPELLILDEPSAGLDVSGRRRVWALVGELRDKHGTTIVWTSHYIEELERNCDRIAVIDAGRVVRIGAPRSLVGEFGRTRAIVSLTDLAERSNALRAMQSLGLPTTLHASGIEVEDRDIGGRLPSLLSTLHAAGIVANGVQIVTPTLEDAYIRLVEGAKDSNE